VCGRRLRQTRRAVLAGRTGAPRRSAWSRHAGQTRARWSFLPHATGPGTLWVWIRACNSVACTRRGRQRGPPWHDLIRCVWRRDRRESSRFVDRIHEHEGDFHRACDSQAQARRRRRRTEGPPADSLPDLGRGTGRLDIKPRISYLIGRPTCPRPCCEAWPSCSQRECRAVRCAPRVETTWRVGAGGRQTWQRVYHA